MVELFFATLLLTGPTSVQDTTFQVREGDQLVLRDFSGTVEVEGWDRSELWAEVDDFDALPFRLSRAGDRVTLDLADRRSRREAEELRIQLPRWMALEISGRELDVDVKGLENRVTVRTLEGDITLEELMGEVDASTVEGSIEARDLRGSARLKTGDDDITVLDTRGRLEIETVSGDVDLLRSSTESVDVRTTDGDVSFDGRLLPSGVYAFHSHSGDLTLNLEPPVDADVTVLVYKGELESDFPMRAQGYRSGQDLRFSIGEGGAKVLLDAFDGEVRLRRARGSR